MGPFARTVWTANPIWQEKTYLGGMDGIALGCLCALVTERLLRRGDAWKKAWSMWLIALEVVGAAMMLLIAVWPPWHWMRYVGRSGVDGTMLAAGACLVMIGSVVRGNTGRLWMAPIRWFGRHSYEVYLTHEFVVVWGTMLYVKVRRGPMSLWFLGILLLSAPLGWLRSILLSAAEWAACCVQPQVLAMPHRWMLQALMRRMNADPLPCAVESTVGPV